MLMSSSPFKGYQGHAKPGNNREIEAVISSLKVIKNKSLEKLYLHVCVSVRVKVVTSKLTGFNQVKNSF